MPRTPWSTGHHTYPKVRRSGHVDEFQSATRGKLLVPDPHHWMGEDTPEVQEELEKFVDAQNNLVREYLRENPNMEGLERAMYDSNMYSKVCAVKSHSMVHGFYNFNGNLFSTMHQLYTAMGGGTGSTIPA